MGKSRHRWTVVFVPPGAHGRIRRLSIHTRTLVSVSATVLVLGVGAATWTGETTSIASATADQLAASQLTVATLRDSVLVLGAVAADHIPPRNGLMPVNGEITSAFSDSRLHPILGILRAHRGVDIAAPKGTPIVAMAAGEVKSVSWHIDYGLTVEIAHTGDVVTRYAHCSAALVHVGDHVQAGQVIARVGSTGLATGPHVHFEVVVRGTAIDPLAFLAATRDAPATIITGTAAGEVGQSGK